MRRKESRVKLSPNEEEQLLREELDRRRKLRLQQVREQERFIAAQVRRQVQERRQKQLQTLADSLQQHWQQQHTHRLQALHTHYQRSLSAVGEGHRSATHNEPDEQCVSQKRVERQERANERHREALRELNTRRHEEQQQQRRLMEARRRALLEEKRRTQRVCSLPPPPPDPLQGVVLKTPRPLRSTAAELVSITHTAVDRETDTQPQSAQQAAAQESERLEDLQREQDEEQQQRLQRARERGEHALRREQHTQDRARLLCDLQRLQHADLQRRSQALHSVPAQVFQPLYRQQELRDQQQRDLEIAFQDLYTQQRKVKGDWLLQMVPEPLPPPSAASHDEELDVTLDPCETPPTDSPESSADPGRRALSTLLERIRSRREPRTGEEEEESGGVEEEEDQSAGVEEKQNTGVEEPATTDGPDVSDDAVVAGHLLPADHTHTQVEETAERQSGAHTHIQEEEEHPDDPSAVFLPLPTEVTLNQSVDLSPLHAELAVSDWLESADQSHHALQQMRSEPQAEPQAETSADPLSITHESLCEAENSSMSAPQEEDPPAQEVMSAVKESTLTELLERAQAAGELKGILEESVLSFISLPDSESSAAAQDEELSRAEEQHSAQSEPAFPHAVMLLEAQCSPAQRRHRARLAQRSALRAAQIKHTHRRNTTHIPHNPSTTHTQPTSASADGLKSVCEVRICTEEHRRQQEAEMLQRTHRLYSQLEEVKQRKQIQIRQQSNANNRERARDFHRKTLEKLRARPKS